MTIYDAGEVERNNRGSKTENGRVEAEGPGVQGQSYPKWAWCWEVLKLTFKI